MSVVRLTDFVPALDPKGSANAPPHQPCVRFRLCHQYTETSRYQEGPTIISIWHFSLLSSSSVRPPKSHLTDIPLLGSRDAGHNRQLVRPFRCYHQVPDARCNNASTYVVALFLFVEFPQMASVCLIFRHVGSLRQPTLSLACQSVGG